MGKTLASLASLAFLANLALAQSVVLPSAQASAEGDVANRFPFGPQSGETIFRYQQAYSAAGMAPLVGQSITSIAFRMNQSEGDQPSHSYGGFVLDVSTNNNLVDNLNSFNLNHGADRTTVFSGAYVSPPLEGDLSPNPFDFVIVFQTPFPYNGGDLLIDVTYASTSAPEFYLDAHWDSNQPIDETSRMGSTSSFFPSFTDTLGLITEISTGSTPVGINYCGPAVANSSGGPATISGTGSASVAADDLTLEARGMPQNQFGYFLNSQTQAFVFPVPNSQGALCLGGQVGRYNANVFNTGGMGAGSLQLDLANTPTPTGTVSIQAGETWNFTCWFRDDNPGPTSNFTDGLEVVFVN